MYCKSSSLSDIMDFGMKTAVSYLRWSSGAQRFGDSRERQISRTKEFCAKHGLSLNLQLVDDGKSASKGQHIGEGWPVGKVY